MAATIICFGVLVMVTLVTCQADDPALTAELQCLDTRPADACNMAVTYPKPVGTLLCDSLTSEADARALAKEPEMAVRKDYAGIKGLVVMFDPDAPIGDNPEDGFIHFIAFAQVDFDGKIQLSHTIIKDYYPPDPPKGHGPHRYQFFFFEYDFTRYLKTPSERKFQLCTFIQDNKLDQPLAVFQFRHENSGKKAT